MESEGLKQLMRKISAIIQEMGVLPRDGNNTYSNYRYVSSERMTERLRELRLKHQVLILPEVIGHEERDHGKTTRTGVTMSFQIIDLETGFSIEKKFFGADQDTMGKSSGQAITECIKRFQFKLFMVVSEEDPDPDRRSHPNGSPEVPQAVPGINQMMQAGIAAMKSATPPPPPPKR